jgi:hypothetical protein
MKQEFEEWAEGKVVLVPHEHTYVNLNAQIAWSAWQRAWNIAIREQRRRDEEEIVALKNKITVATNALTSKVIGERR